MSGERSTLWLAIIGFVLVGGWASVLVMEAGRTARAQEALADAHGKVARIEASGVLRASWPSSPLVFETELPKDPDLSAAQMAERFRADVHAYLGAFPYQER